MKHWIKFSLVILGMVGVTLLNIYLVSNNIGSKDVVTEVSKTLLLVLLIVGLLVAKERK